MEPSTTPAPVVAHDGRAVAQETSITDATPVRLNLRTVLSMIVGIVTLVLGSAGGYYALASTDKALEVKVDRTEKHRRSHRRDPDQGRTRPSGHEDETNTLDTIACTVRALTMELHVLQVRGVAAGQQLIEAAAADAWIRAKRIGYR